MKINEDGTLAFDEEECLDLERLAATGHSLKEMALYFGVSYNLFKKEAYIEGSQVNYSIDRGKKTVKMNASIRLITLAESGNVTAIQQLAKTQKDRDYMDILMQLEDEEEDL